MPETKESQTIWLKRQIMFYLKHHSPEELKKIVEWCIENRANWEKQQEQEVMELMKKYVSKNNEQ